MDGGGERHYGIGDRAPRKEDRRLLTGRGRYADDVRIGGSLQPRPTLACRRYLNPALRGVL